MAAWKLGRKFAFCGRARRLECSAVATLRVYIFIDLVDNEINLSGFSERHWDLEGGYWTGLYFVGLAERAGGDVEARRARLLRVRHDTGVRGRR